jgi:hypothetical protein
VISAFTTRLAAACPAGSLIVLKQLDIKISFFPAVALLSFFSFTTFGFTVRCLLLLRLPSTTELPTGLWPGASPEAAARELGILILLPTEVAATGKTSLAGEGKSDEFVACGWAAVAAGFGSTAPSIPNAR